MFPFLFPFMLVFSIQAFIMAMVAIAPAIWLLVKIYRADFIEHEPLGLIIQLVALGMLSTFFSLITETIGSLLIDIDTGLGRFVMCFIVVALSEEGFKYLCLKRRTWTDPNFNYQFDGVVYAVAVAMGFALLENIEYVFSYGMGTALVRAVTAVPGHACFGVFMGTWYGEAKKYANVGMQIQEERCLRMALIVPVILHGAYNYIASMESRGTWVIFMLFAAALFFYTNRMVKRGAARDTPLL